MFQEYLSVDFDNATVEELVEMELLENTTYMIYTLDELPIKNYECIVRGKYLYCFNKDEFSTLISLIKLTYY
jgi:hypothetical protein